MAPNETFGSSDFGSGTSNFGQQKSGSTTETMKEKASQFGSQAKEAAEAGRERAGAGLSTAGEKIQERAGAMGGPTAKIGAKVGETLASAGQYMQDKDTGEIYKDVETYVKEHPVQAVVGAVIAGIVVGKLIK